MERQYYKLGRLAKLLRQGRVGMLSRLGLEANHLEWSKDVKETWRILKAAIGHNKMVVKSFQNFSLRKFRGKHKLTNPVMVQMVAVMGWLPRYTPHLRPRPFHHRQPNRL